MREPFMLMTHRQTTGGTIAVDAFFIISGFLITASFERSKTLFDYFKKRVFRIYPAFIVSSLLSAVFVLPLSGGRFAHHSVASTCVDFIVETAHLKSFNYVHAFATNPYPDLINGSIWTILYEFLCYIGLAILGVTRLLRTNWFVVSLLAISMGINAFFEANRALFDHLEKAVPGIFQITLLFPHFIAVYMAGVVFYRLRNRIPLRNSWLILALLSLALGTLFAPLWALTFPMAGAYLIFGLAFHPAVRLHNFGKYGDFSYGTYLYAFPIQQLIVHWLNRPTAPLLLFLLALPVTLCVAIFSWYAVERWFLKRAHKNPAHSVGVAGLVKQI